MLDFSEQTYANILERQLNRVTNSIDKREGSIIMTSLGPESWEIEGIYLVLAQLQANSFALTAVGDALDYKAVERGIYRGQATAAHREGIFDVPVPVNSRFSTINGDNSVIFYAERALNTDGSGNPVVGVDGYYHYEMICEEVGTIGNSYIGTLLPVTAIARLTYAQLGDIILAAVNEESDEDLRQRYILSLDEQAFAGNIAAYQQACLEEDDVGAVQVYPHYKGAGTVLCSVLDANFDLATPALIERLQLKICPPVEDPNNPSVLGTGLAPIGAAVDIATGTRLDIDLETTVQLEATATIESVRPGIEAAINDYLLSVRRNWGTLVVTTEVTYPVYVYVSRLVVNLLSVEGVIAVTDTTVNGGTGDIPLTESGTLQQVPFRGTVTLHAAG